MTFDRVRRDLTEGQGVDVEEIVNGEERWVYGYSSLLSGVSERRVRR